MSVQALRPGPDPRLSVALLVSAVLHAVVLLGVGFLEPEERSASDDSLTMVDYMPEGSDQEGPAKPDARSASRSQQAQGSDEANREATAPDAGRTPTPPQPAPAPAPAPEDAPPQPASAEPSPAGPEGRDRSPVLSAPESDTTVATPDKSGSDRKEAAKDERRQGSFQLFPSDREVARWDEQRRQRQSASDSAGPARTATRADAVAAYTNSVLEKVQRIGNMNYPDEARERGLTGKVRLQVRVHPDGTLVAVRVLESSGSDVLDAAAKQIIRLAAPFSPFPEDMRRNHPDDFAISHYLNFSRGGGMDESPQN
ncbi:MAG TPA: energy transducer TonB [Gammaproteobacteria bacterium]|nr:energy transducer TonB [Gammaproteobacteria bacterium]